MRTQLCESLSEINHINAKHRILIRWRRNLPNPSQYPWDDKILAWNLILFLAHNLLPKSYQRFSLFKTQNSKIHRRFLKQLLKVCYILIYYQIKHMHFFFVLSKQRVCNVSK